MRRKDAPTSKNPYSVPRYYAPGYGERLKSARLAKGLSQAEACRYTQNVIPDSALSLAERECREIGVDKLRLLAGLYGVRTVWLVTGTGPRMLSEPDEVEELGEAPDPPDAPE